MPIILVVDLETTGMEPPAEVIELGYCELVDENAHGWQIGDRGAELYYAETNPPEARAVNHIDPRHLRGCPPFEPELVLKGWTTWTGPTLYAAHHADFEQKWLGEAASGKHWICTWKSALRLWPDAPSHSNQVLRYWLEDQGLLIVDEMLAEPAHRAGPDAYVTAFLLQQMLSLTSAKQMVAWTRDPALLPRCPIGEWRGRRWAEVDTGFLSWMTRQRDMDPDYKWNASRELANRGM